MKPLLENIIDFRHWVRSHPSAMLLGAHRASTLELVGERKREDGLSGNGTGVPGDGASHGRGANLRSQASVAARGLKR